MSKAKGKPAAIVAPEPEPKYDKAYFDACVQAEHRDHVQREAILPDPWYICERDYELYVDRDLGMTLDAVLASIPSSVETGWDQVIYHGQRIRAIVLKGNPEYELVYRFNPDGTRLTNGPTSHFADLDTSRLSPEEREQLGALLERCVVAYGTDQAGSV